MRVRPACPADHPAMVALNREAVPAMGEVPIDFFDRLAPHATAFLVAEREAPIGFLLALPPGAPYESENYRWFSARYPDFVYVDRVAVTAAERGRGVGRSLYAALEASLGATFPERPLCCEVNLRPPNPGSLAFHRRLGFRVVGEQETGGGAQRVALMMRPAPERARHCTNLAPERGA
jgi:uncharacterized protein